jgi:hypothetical protein
MNKVTTDNSVRFMQGELVATARRMLDVYMRCGTQYDGELLQLQMVEAELELARLIGNAFGLRNSIGDPVQTSLLILLMHGEQHKASEMYHPKN